MKRIFLAAICTLTALSAYGQAQTAPPAISPCTLNIAKAPAIRGVKLGMKTDEVLALFPGSAENDGIKSSIRKPDDYPNCGVVGITVFPSQYSTKDRFAGIGDFSFLFLDGRIAEYRVAYQGPPSGPTWYRVDDFIAKLADTFGLPPASDWTADQNLSSRKTLKCDGFQLQAVGSGSLTVSTPEPPYKKQWERRAAYEEKLRRDFKP
jgi:hypothetical protein